MRWRTFDEYFRLIEQQGVPLNVVHNVGAAQVRRVVIGEEAGAPTPQQMDQIRNLVKQAMEDGAIGFSTALIYPPRDIRDHRRADRDGEGRRAIWRCLLHTYAQRE